MLSGWVTT